VRIPRSDQNDAEAVVRTIAPSLNGRRLFYFDSQNSLDELKADRFGFAGFAPGASEEIRRALKSEGLL
jgi:hypothetical protein